MSGNRHREVDKIIKRITLMMLSAYLTTTATMRPPTACKSSFYYLATAHFEKAHL